MHLGNICTALISYASAKAQGGSWVLRIEDLDPQRSKPEYARLIFEDLLWLGLEPDEGGPDDRGSSAPYTQSARHSLYEAALGRLAAQGLVYPCRCTRAEIRAAQAPHASDGHVIYPGTCRPPQPRIYTAGELRGVNVRLRVPDETVTFTDGLAGECSVNLARQFGEIVLRRADGAWAYQLAVTVDDALMGITEVVRGDDLLTSAAIQIHLHRLLGYEPPRYIHLPLLRNADGLRLSKRDASLAMDALRNRYTPAQLRAHLRTLAAPTITRLASLHPDISRFIGK